MQTCSSPRSLPAHPWVPRHPLLRARAYPGSAWRLVAVLPEGEDVCKTGLEASLYLTERPSQPYPVPLLHTSTQLSTPAPTRGSVALPRVPLEPSPASGAKPTHLLAPPPARTASCPSYAWAGAPRSHLRLLLPAPAVGITPARLQPACPSPATRGRLEARNLLIPLATAAGLGTFFLNQLGLRPPAGGRGRGAGFLYARQYIALAISGL